MLFGLEQICFMLCDMHESEKKVAAKEGLEGHEKTRNMRGNNEWHGKM